MIEVGDELSIAARMRQIGPASRELMREISETRWNYYASYVTDFICPFLFIYLGMGHGVGRAAMIAGVVSGVVTFTLIEYSIHRWMLHDPNNVLYPLHEVHHNEPERPSAFLFPTSIVVLGLVWLVFAKGLHLPSLSFFIAGIAAGYCYFGAIHHLEHSIRINQIPWRWMQKRWAAHSVHHRLNQNNFGVMTSFWDHVFGTQMKPGKNPRQRA